MQTLSGRTSEIRTGIGVSYGSTQSTGDPFHVVTKLMGYSNDGPHHVFIHVADGISGHGGPMICRLSIASVRLSLDLSEIPGSLLKCEPTVESIGPTQSVDNVAANAGKISYLLQACVGLRYPSVLRGPPLAQQSRTA